MWASQFSSSVSVQVYLDNDWRKCYLFDDESFEAEQCFEAFDVHSVMLENVDNDYFDLNHCNTQRYALLVRKCSRSPAVEPNFLHTRVTLTRLDGGLIVLYNDCQF